MIPTLMNSLPEPSGARGAPLGGFGGLDRRESASNGAIKDMAHMTTDHAPLLYAMGSVKGAELFPGQKAHGMLAMGDYLLLFFGKCLCVCKWPEIGKGEVYGDDGGAGVNAGGTGAGSEADSGGGGGDGAGGAGTALGGGGAGAAVRETESPLSDTDKVLCAMGERALIWPEKLMWTAENGLQSLDATYTAAGLVFSDGTYYGEEAEHNTVTTAGDPFPFRVGDAVTFSPCVPTGGEEKTAIIREMDNGGRIMRFYENTFAENGAVAEEITVRRFVPDLDHVCVNDNRVWGCKGDTIWASKLGDPTNWMVFDGLATDSWSAESGTAGDFTACVSYLGQATFFKEDRIFRMYGTKPTNFELTPSSVLGVYPGAARTLAVAGETLFYLSRVGVIRYNGGSPKKADAELGDVVFDGPPCGGGDGVRYWFSAHEAGTDRDDLLCYDATAGVWAREGAQRFHAVVCWRGVTLAQYTGGIQFLRDPTRLGVVAGEDVEIEDFGTVGFVELADFDFHSFDRKYPVRLWVRTRNQNAIQIRVCYDGGQWEDMGQIPGGSDGETYLPFPVRRCGRFGLQFTGAGKWYLRSLEIESRTETEARR